jgi:diguanylate cyclase (GGDEF)-like protein
MDRDDPVPTSLELAVRVMRPMLVLLAFGLLAVFEPVMLIDAEPWLLALASGAVAVFAAAGTVLALVLGLRHGGAGLPAAAAAGAFAVAYAVATIGWTLAALDQPVEIEPARVTLAGELAAALLLPVAAAVGARHGRSRMRLGGRILRLVALFVLVEAVLAAALLLPAAGGPFLVARPVAAAVLAITGVAVLIAGVTTASSWRRRSPAMAEACLLLGAGVGTLSLARAGTLEVAPGIAALSIGIIGFALALRPASAGAAVTIARPERDPEVAGLLMRAAAEEAARRDGRDEASRLTRELRGTVNELTEARRTIARQRKELDRAVRVDELTGVASRRAILERLETEVAEAHRYAHPLAVLLVDVDGLSMANGSGWEGGDAVLRELALRIRLRVRSADGIGRLGEDSFLAILPHTTEEGAVIFAETLRQRVAARPVETDTGSLEVRVSIGVATLHPGLEMAAVELLALAEAAVREAQHGGGNCVAVDQLRRLPRRFGADGNADVMAEEPPGA